MAGQAQHTPGPWRVVPGNDYYIESNHRMVARKFAAALNVPTGEGVQESFFIAEVSNGVKDFGEANAYLISAAPEMFDALAGAPEPVDFEQGIGVVMEFLDAYLDWHEKRTAALAKARGEE